LIFHSKRQQPGDSSGSQVTAAAVKSVAAATCNNKIAAGDNSNQIVEDAIFYGQNRFSEIFNFKLKLH